MASRSTIRTWLLDFLGTTSDDPLFSATRLNPILQQAVDSLLGEITSANPSYLTKTQVLAADSVTSHTYSFATQSPAIPDFSRWIEVRFDNADGVKLLHARLEELTFAGDGYFDVVGPDETAQLITSPDTDAGTALWMRWAYWPTAMADDNAVPTGIPSRFHDVVALEALFAFGLGAEQRRPPELLARWVDRKAQLIAQVSRRGVATAFTRLDPTKPLPV